MKSWQVGEGMGRHFVAVKCAKSSQVRADSRRQLLALEGIRLACSYGLDRLCDGDVLMHLFHALLMVVQGQGGQ